MIEKQPNVIQRIFGNKKFKRTVLIAFMFPLVWILIPWGILGVIVFGVPAVLTAILNWAVDEDMGTFLVFAFLVFAFIWMVVFFSLVPDKTITAFAASLIHYFYGVPLELLHSLVYGGTGR